MKKFLTQHLTEAQIRSLNAGRTSLMKFFKPVFRLFGVDAFIRKPDYHYVPDTFGRAAHKQEDIRRLPIFGELAAEVITSGRSSLYYDRLFTIYQLLVQLKSSTDPRELINTAEVGAYKGGTSHFIAAAAGRLDLKLEHHCFDTFEGHDARDLDRQVDLSHHTDTFTDTSYAGVRDYLAKFNSVTVHPGRFQDTCQVLQEKRMHLVYLDMDIYEPTIFALRFFERRILPGGVILLDDHGFTTCPGIARAASEFIGSAAGYFGMPLLSGQYILIKITDQE